MARWKATRCTRAKSKPSAKKRDCRWSSVPVSIVATFVAAFIFALAHDLSFTFLGVEVLG